MPEEQNQQGGISPEILSALKEKLPEGEIEGQLQSVIDEHYGLIPKSAAATLLAARLGVLKRREIPLGAIRKGDRNFKTAGFVERVYPAYVPNNDEASKSVRIVICDEKQGNSTTVAMWGPAANLAEKELSINDRIEIDGCGFRNGEITCYAGCEVRIAQKAPMSSVRGLKYGLVNVKGIVSEIFPDYYYMRNGREQYMSSFKLTQPEGSVRVVAWHDPTVVKKLELGMQVSCQNCLFKNNEIHVNQYSRLVFMPKSPQDAKSCEITGISADGQAMTVQTDQGEIRLEGEGALKFLGISELPEGITLESVASLKKNSLLGRRIACMERRAQGPHALEFMGFEG
ncbi:MAG: hypothetical protein WC506_02750 [Candidatus Micrarchaeia archaeon]